MLSVADLKLRPGEVATVWLECADLRGDQRPGKLSRSRRIELRLFSIERAHTRLLGALAEVAMQWTLRLAARLETPVYQAKEVPAARGRRDTLKGAEETALKALDELITAFEDDPLADSKSIAELSAVARELRSALEREAAQLRKIRPEMSAMAFRLLGSRLKRQDDRCVDKVERGIEKMVQLLQFEHGARMRRMANKLSRLEDRLEEVLKRLQDSPDDEDLLAEAQRLTEAIDRAMKAMLASAMARMPLAPAEAAHAGASAQRDRPARRHADHLQEIKDALRRGDVKAAQRALKANRERMRATLGGLNKGLSKEQVERDAQTGRWVQRLRSSIDQLESAQGGVRELAAPLADAQRRNADREIKNRFDARQQELQSLLSDARDQLRSKRLRTMSARNAMGVARARAALAEVAKSLDERRLDRALRGVTEAASRCGRPRTSLGVTP